MTAPWFSDIVSIIILPISHQIAVIYHGRLLTMVNRGDHNATEIENLIMHGVPVLEEAMEGV